MGQQGYWQRASRRRVLGVAATGGVGLAAAALAGCGDDDDDDDVASPTAPAAGGTAAAPATQPAAAGNPVPGGVLKITQAASAATLDVHQSASIVPSRDPGSAYSKLVKYNAGKDGVTAGNFKVEGDLAESWEQVDPTTVTFKLRKGVKYHNIAPVNGREWTAADAIYSFTRQRELKINASYLADIQSLDAPDPYTLRVKLVAPNVDFLLSLAAVLNKADIPKERAEATGNDLKGMPLIGTGPFILKSWDATTRNLSLVKNPDYFIKGIPYLDQHDMNIALDPALAQAAFRTGEAAFYIVPSSAPQSQIDALIGSNKDKIRILKTAPAYVGPTLKVNAGRTPGKDPRVRQALAYVMDPEQVKKALYPIVDVRYSAQVVLPTWDWVVSDAVYKKYIKSDMAEAKKLLEAAGATNWAPEIIINTVDGTSPPLGPLLHAKLQALGLKPTIKEVDTAAFNSIVAQRREYDLQIGTQGAGGGPSGDLQVRFKTGGSLNMVQTSDPDLDKLIDQQQGEANATARRNLWQQIQEKILATYGFIPMGTSSTTVLQWNWLRDDYTPIAGLYLDNEFRSVWIAR